MKLFSNFNTLRGQEIYDQKVQEYGDGNVVFLKRSKLYWYLNGVPRLLTFIILNIAIIFYGGVILAHEYIFLAYLFLNVVILWFLIGKIYVNYLCDFAIASPIGIYFYDQKGLLFNYFMEIPVIKIQAVRVKRQSLLGNFFGLGDIHVLIDNVNDHLELNEQQGLITMRYVENSEDIQAHICKICFNESDHEKQAGPANEGMDV